MNKISLFMKRWIYNLTISAFLFTTFARMQSQLISSTVFPKVFLFGDSLTQKGFHDGGWCSRLVETYERRCDFLNRGFNGYTSRMAKYIVASLLMDSSYPSRSLYAAVLLLGTNDSVLKELDDRAVPIDEYKENIKQIIQVMETYGIPKERILLVTPPPMNETEYGKTAAAKKVPNSFRSGIVAKYAAACMEVGKEVAVQTLDLWTEMMKLENWSTCLSDGLHFGERGHQFMFVKVKEILDRTLGQLGMVYPDWKIVNHVQPETTFRSPSLNDLNKT